MSGKEEVVPEGGKEEDVVRPIRFYVSFFILYISFLSLYIYVIQGAARKKFEAVLWKLWHYPLHIFSVNVGERIILKFRESIVIWDIHIFSYMYYFFFEYDRVNPNGTKLFPNIENCPNFVIEYTVWNIQME